MAVKIALAYCIRQRLVSGNSEDDLEDRAASIDHLPAPFHDPFLGQSFSVKGIWIWIKDSMQGLSTAMRGNAGRLLAPWPARSALLDRLSQNWEVPHRQAFPLRAYQIDRHQERQLHWRTQIGARGMRFV